MICCIGRLAHGKSDGLKGWTVPRGEPRTSGNAAFDEYREETLKRLEKERAEFAEFLQRLRRARDKVEFDEFMAERAATESQT